MQEQFFDVLIPVARKDISFVRRVTEYVRLNITGVKTIYIITAKNNFKRLSGSHNLHNYVLLDENSLLDGLSFSNVRRLLANVGENRPSQTGWYFQQFLKFAFAQTKYARDYYLTWDADTLPVNKIAFFKDGKPLFTRKIEYHAPYFKTMNRLIGIPRQVDYSFIAEHMLFKTSVVRELISEISRSAVRGDMWFEKIVNACNFAKDKANLFSEFETYGNYCAKNHPDMYETRTLNTFRAAGLIRGRHINNHIINRLAVDLHIASFEMQDAPFPYNVDWNLYRARRKIISLIGSRVCGGGW